MLAAVSESGQVGYCRMCEENDRESRDLSAETVSA